MTPVRFSVPGKPQGKARPRFARMGRGVRAYTPASTQAYERAVRAAALAAMAPGTEAAYAAYTGAVHVFVHAVFPVPASWPAKRRQAAFEGSIVPTVKPDSDNVAKAVLDGLRGVCFADDAQVTWLCAAKQYGPDPGLSVAVAYL